MINNKYTNPARGILDFCKSSVDPSYISNGQEDHETY